MAWNPGSGPQGSKRNKKKKKSLGPCPIKHIRRTNAQVKVGTQILVAQVILNDMNALGMELFLPTAIAPETEAMITMEYPTRFFVKCVVLSSEELQSTHRVLAETPIHFRAHVQFQFDSAEQQDAVKNHVEKILASCVHTEKKAA